ncbi:MAG: hypothetical protein H0W19_03115 [Nitrosopumilus sp.]|nr:hypothetical protein [Nitrosopumilus sp.]
MASILRYPQLKKNYKNRSIQSW